MRKIVRLVALAVALVTLPAALGGCGEDFPTVCLLLPTAC
jgi:hypothetical protein